MKKYWGILRQWINQVFQNLVKRFSIAKLLAILVVVVLSIGCFFGLLIGSGVFSDILQRNMTQKIQLNSLEQELLESKKTIAEQEITHQIDSQALRDVAKSIKSLEYDLATTQRELKYYQTLMGDIQTSSKPFVRDVSLFNTEDGEIGYRIVVQQGNTGQGKSSEIKLQVEITGLTDEGLTTLPLAEFDPAFPNGEEAFNIKYYKLLEGHILLPNTFAPAEIVTKTWVKGQKNQTTENRFNWSVTTPGDLPEDPTE